MRWTNARRCEAVGCLVEPLKVSCLFRSPLLVPRLFRGIVHSLSPQKHEIWPPWGGMAWRAV